MLLLVLLSLTLMTLDHRERHLQTIRSALTALVYPLQYVADLPANIGDWANQSLASRSSLIQENQALLAEHLKLQARLLQFSALERENERLRELLRSSSRVGVQVLIGELLSVDMDPFKRTIFVNKGSKHAIHEGQPLLDAYGVMGQVISVAPFSSVAMLLTDPSHAIPVQVNRNGLRTIALGTGASDHLEIPHLPNNADIKEGDLLVSSGLGQRFPPGYPVAVVNQVVRDPTQPYAMVSARPTAQLERSREVLLVWNGEQER